MKNRVVALITQAVVAATALVVGSAASVTGAAAAEVPMCNGRTDANTVVTAHANGPRTFATVEDQQVEVPKFILNVSTDPFGEPTGSLILDRGPGRLYVTDFCRVWQHLPGQPSMGECTYPEGATTAHAVGVTTYGNENVIVRADVRKLASGDMKFRVRYGPVAAGDEGGGGEEEGGCGGDEESTWTRVPAEGWLPLDQMRTRVVTD